MACSGVLLAAMSAAVSSVAAQQTATPEAYAGIHNRRNFRIVLEPLLPGCKHPRNRKVIPSNRPAHRFQPNLRASKPNLRSRRRSSRRRFSSRLRKSRWVPLPPSLRMPLGSPHRNLQV